jgi:hypothetical protein
MESSEKFDLLDYVSFKTVSAGLLGSIVAAWVISPLWAIGLFFIGLILLLGGEWYAREIYRRPWPETYKSVIVGNVILGAGITLASSWINIVGVSQWLQPVMWIWCIVLCGGPQVAWQRRKLDEQKNKNNVAGALLGDKLTKD